MYYVIVNPTAGKGKAIKIFKKLSERLDISGIEYKTVFTEHKFHASELSKNAALDGYKSIIAVGGDGTVSEVANGIVLSGVSDAVMGVVACGTGNDLIRSLNIPKDMDKSLDIILKGSILPIDIGRMNDKYFFNVSSVGFDVEVVQNTEYFKGKMPGSLAYFCGIIKTLFCLRFKKLTYSIDGGEPVEQELLLLAAANGKYYGGGIKVSPYADLKDGILDIVVIEKVKKRIIPFMLGGFMKGKHTKIKEITHTDASSVLIEADGIIDINLDGEIISGDKMMFTVERAGLKVFV